MPRVSPSPNVKLTSLTAWATPSRVWNSTCRFSTSRSGAELSKLSPLSGDFFVRGAASFDWVLAVRALLLS